MVVSGERRNEIAFAVPNHMARCCPSFLLSLVATLAAAPGVACSAMAQPAESEVVSVESLLKEGWQIAGYSGTADGWSAFILFRHPSEPYLVQCRAGYDVTREKRVQTNCYRLR
jgi:hypothetical protein